MKPLVDAGYVAFAYGGADQGKFLCHHQLVDCVHLTGSEKTYDAIVWNGKPKVSAKPRPCYTEPEIRNNQLCLVSNPFRFLPAFLRLCGFGCSQK